MGVFAVTCQAAFPPPTAEHQLHFTLRSSDEFTARMCLMSVCTGSSDCDEGQEKENRDILTNGVKGQEVGAVPCSRGL